MGLTLWQVIRMEASMKNATESGFPNLYASEDHILAMTGQQSWIKNRKSLNFIKMYLKIYQSGHFQETGLCNLRQIEKISITNFCKIFQIMGINTHVTSYLVHCYFAEVEKGALEKKPLSSKHEQSTIKLCRINQVRSKSIFVINFIHIQAKKFDF